LSTDSAAVGAGGRGIGVGPIAAALAGLAALALLLLAAVAVVGGASIGAGASQYEGASDGPTVLAEREIPPTYLRLYEQAARRYGLDWAILAGIGKVECDHGRDPAPSCTQEGQVNAAGAGGPMQFLVSTWAEYGVDADGDGHVDRWDPADAIYGAANYLRASGAPGDYSRAIFAYNHASWYVAEVERWAEKYAGAPIASSPGSGDASPAAVDSGLGSEDIEGADVRLAQESQTPVRFIAGEQAELDPHDGHVALIPAGVPASVQAMIVAGNELQDLPYGPGGHPDPLGAPEEDCSSTVNYVLYRSGVRPLDAILTQNPVAQSYVSWGAPGRGRWVTIYASASPEPHVFITIAGLRLDTSHNGTDVGPNRDEDGPRWRILDHIPTWAHWSVRHPPGL
jgi:transglycosylase-like protein with SLT domain